MHFFENKNDRLDIPCPIDHWTWWIVFSSFSYTYLGVNENALMISFSYPCSYRWAFCSKQWMYQEINLEIKASFFLFLCHTNLQMSEVCYFVCVRLFLPRHSRKHKTMVMATKHYNITRNKNICLTIYLLCTHKTVK